MPRINQAGKANSPTPGIPVGEVESTSPVGEVSDRPVGHGSDVINGQDNQPMLAGLTPTSPSNEVHVPRSTDPVMMNRKPVFYRHADTVLNMEGEEFREKLLCDGIVMNLGDACAFGCKYCYVEAVMLKLDSSILDPYNRDHGTALGFQDVVIRRKGAIKVLRSQLLNEDGTSRYPDPTDNRVVYTSTLVDPAANMELLRETAEACNLILEHTHWQIRILSKSVLLRRLIEDEMIPAKYHDRLILGFSIGTLDDRVARAIEVGTSLVSGRLAALHWLQDRGIRTFGMICPSLPQDDYDTFSREICAAIRVDRCEHVWGEVLNVRGESRQKTLAALQGAGLTAEAGRFQQVFFDENASENWEQYARRTFLAHTRHVPVGKLRFLQYIDDGSADWWKSRRSDGAVLIGEVAKLRLLQAGGESAPRQALVPLTQADVAYRDEREQTVQTGVTAGIAAARALYEIHSYKDGLLWRRDYASFEQYFQAKLYYAKSHGYRLLNLGGFIAELENASPHGGDCRLPLNEGQVRPLLKVVPKPNQVACWGGIIEVHDVSDLTGPMVEKAAKAYVKKEGLVSRQKAKPRKPDDRAKAIRSVVSLRAVLGKLSNPGRFKPLIQGIMMLLGVDDTGAEVVETQTVAVESEPLIDGVPAPESPDKVPDAAPKARRKPKPSQSPAAIKKVAARNGRKDKAS